MKTAEYYIIEPTDDGFDVYEYGEYSSGSVLAGQPRRSFVGSYRTLELAQKDFPKAEVGEAYKLFTNFGHLPDENGNTYTREGYDL